MPLDRRLSFLSALLVPLAWLAGPASAQTRLADINPAGGSDPVLLGTLDGAACMMAFEGEAAALWRSDGTAAGTRRVTTGMTLDTPSAEAVVHQGAIYLPALSPQGGLQLWRTDCTSQGTAVVADFAGALPLPMGGAGGLVYVRVLGDTETIWATDGTAEGTLLLTGSTPPGPGAPPQRTRRVPGSALPSFVALGDDAFFAAADELGNSHLWHSDGTVAGTAMVEGSPSGVSELIALGDAVYFLGQDGPSWQLYRADRSGNLEPLTEYPDLRRVLPFGRELALVVREAGPSGYSILIGDGTPAGSRTVAEGLGEPGLWSSSGGRFYVSTDQTRLWVGDGSPGGTLQVRDFALIDQGRSVDGRLAVSADDGPHGLEPWTSDGAAASTAQVGDICGGSCSSGPTIFAPVGQQILVSADDGTGAEPWAIPTPAVAGELVLPADGSLVRSTTHFEWTAGGQALEYWLQLGTTPGGHDLRDVSDGTHLAASVSGLPFDGSTIHARLWTRLPAPTGWVYRDATYQALSGAAAKLVEPASGPVGGPITLRWTSGENALEYWPQAGWSTGGTDLLDASNGMRRHVSLTVPSEGRTLHVRLWTRLPAPRGWVYTDSSFATEDLGEPAEVTAPAPGTALPSFQATFQWSTGGNAREYWLQAGRTQGSHSLHDASTGLLRSVSLANLPLDGGAVWVRLWTRLPAPRGWEYRDASYTAAGVGGVAAQLTAPAPWTLYTGPTLGLAWTSATGAQEYWLRVFAGGELVHDASAGLALARSLSLQPLPGGVSVQLWTRFPGAGWVMLDSYFPTP